MDFNSDTLEVLIEAPVISEFSGRNLIPYTVFPFCLFGIISNAVIVWVWSADRAYSPTVYLFKALAVADNLFLISWFPYFYTVKDAYVSEFLGIMTFGNRKFGLQITLVLAVVRVIMVYFPLHTNVLLTRFRIKVVLCCLMTFTLAMITFDESNLFYFGNEDTKWLISLTTRLSVGFLLPATAQIVLMIAVIWKVWQHSTKYTALNSDQSPDQTNQSDSLKPALEKRGALRFVYVAFAMCLTSFLACVVAVVIVMIVKHQVSLKQYWALTGFLFSLVGMLNSSINIFFYIGIAKFRLTLKAKLTTLLLSPSSMSDDQTLKFPEGETLTRNSADCLTVPKGNVVGNVSSNIAACSFETEAASKNETTSTFNPNDTLIT